MGYPPHKGESVQQTPETRWRRLPMEPALSLMVAKTMKFGLISRRMHGNALLNMITIQP
jgi:hypothetical protein